MLHHVEIYVSDLALSRAFWTPLLAHVGYLETDHWENGFTLKAAQETYLTFVHVEDRHADRPYHRCAVGLNHLAFTVPDRAGVDTLHQFCVEQNISRLYEDRYPFANGGSDYYALFIEDPDRIKVEFVAKG
ncbi:VOC family protein [Yoonia sp. BS5-3]|uniref:VOC family protein n=1 Tax=Yoonia phaeophyticola TaxID=3137369 RepID=A0ABZ2V889_9RHOB